MGEHQEFAEALLGQLSVEINEEKEISELSSKINEDTSFTLKFDELEKVCEYVFPIMAEKIKEFFGIPISPTLKLEYLKLKEFKKYERKKSLFV